MTDFFFRPQKWIKTSFKAFRNTLALDVKCHFLSLSFPEASKFLCRRDNDRGSSRCLLAAVTPGISYFFAATLIEATYLTSSRANWCGQTATGSSGVRWHISIHLQANMESQRCNHVLSLLLILQRQVCQVCRWICISEVLPPWLFDLLRSHVLFHSSSTTLPLPVVDLPHSVSSANTWHIFAILGGSLTSTYLWQRISCPAFVVNVFFNPKNQLFSAGFPVNFSLRGQEHIMSLTPVNHRSWETGGGSCWNQALISQQQCIRVQNYLLHRALLFQPDAAWSCWSGK